MSQTPSRVLVVQDAADLRAENERLREELEAFDPAFFEEIEDLKVREKK